MGTVRQVEAVGLFFKLRVLIVALEANMDQYERVRFEAPLTMPAGHVSDISDSLIENAKHIINDISMVGDQL